MDSSVFNEFIGKKWGTDATEDKLRTKGTFNSIRVLNEGDMATMDFQETRINVNLDSNGNVASIHYG